MTDTNVDIQDVLSAFREIVGQQAQEIATLRAVITSLKQRLGEKEETSSEKTN